MHIPHDMQLTVADGGRAGDYPVIRYRGVEILFADDDYKPELRPGPFFVIDEQDDMHEFATLDDVREFIDNDISELLDKVCECLGRKSRFDQ